jgi:hypothetical protein
MLASLRARRPPHGWGGLGARGADASAGAQAGGSRVGRGGAHGRAGDSAPAHAAARASGGAELGARQQRGCAGGDVSDAGDRGALGVGIVHHLARRVEQAQAQAGGARKVSAAADRVGLEAAVGDLGGALAAAERALGASRRAGGGGGGGGQGPGPCVGGGGGRESRPDKRPTRRGAGFALPGPRAPPPSPLPPGNSPPARTCSCRARRARRCCPACFAP